MQIYRRDIDGLRAIAVVAVVLFHAGLPGFGGGYLGVDVFFVISGFLITQVLTGDGAEAAGILRFYARRVRRIAPALMLVLAACTIAALVYFSPFETKAYAKSLLAAAAFVSNFVFMQGSGYFQPQSGDDPLLHLWSLSVEEQFYVVYPLFLLAMRRAPRTWLAAALAVMLAASLALSSWLAVTHPTAAFYATPSRAWEILLGAAVAVRLLRTGKTAAEPLALAALAAIVLPVALYGQSTPWPGLFAAIPCLGTAILLAQGGTPTLVSRMLGSRPLAGIGLISYSLYLWHWPVFVFFARAVLRPIAPAEYAVLIAVSAAAAWLSWRFVEQPFRRGHGRVFAFGVAGAATAVLLLAGGALYASGGWASRASPEVRRIDAYLGYPATAQYVRQFNIDTCFVRDGSPPYDFAHCFVPASDRRNVVLWGDSHAMHFFPGLAAEAQRHGVHLIQATFHGCAPVIDGRMAHADCAAFNRQILAALDRRIAAVILSAQMSGTAPEDLLDTARRVAARGVGAIVFGPSPEYPVREPLYLEREAETGDTAFSNSTGRLKAGLAFRDFDMNALIAQRPGITYVSVLGTVCPRERCPMRAGGAPVQFDTAHLTAEGSALFGALLWPRIAPALNSPPHGR